MLEALESIVGEKYMLSTIRKLVSLQQFFDLSTFLHYFNEIKLDANNTAAEAFEFWFMQGGFPSLLVENKESFYLIRQKSTVLWPLRLSSPSFMPRFLFAESMTLHKVNIPLINLNFTSFMRVNYDPSTWTSIVRFMLEKPSFFSPIGRAQLVTDFCYFYAHGQVQNGSLIKNSVIHMVYENPEWFDLCDWNLYWCHATAAEPHLASLISRFTRSISSIFKSDLDFGCASRFINQNAIDFLNMVIGKKYF